ncbi:MAG: TetR family transcriptional regulator [Pantoea sp. Pent]|nr:TetR family transcriptional regulator [Pantoea sp. Pent]
MKKNLSATAIVTEGLKLLDEAGIEGISTRKIARRLGVEQPALYWHFKNKEMLLQAMAVEAMQSHRDFPLPDEDENLKKWFINNMKSFRQALLCYRDGARLHAYHVPGDDTGRLEQKLGVLMRQGIAEQDATLALMTASKFTVGFVLEEQQESSLPQLNKNSPFFITDKDYMYECGLEMITRNLFMHGQNNSV